MKSWPSALADRYSSQYGCKTRPWWEIQLRMVEGRAEYEIVAVRRDDADIEIRAPKGSMDETERQELLEPLLEQMDLQHPIPHPGFRAGQIWGNEYGGSVQIVSCDPHGHHPNCVDDTDVPIHLNRFLPGLYPYLIADPACPHLAPWSPA